MARPVAYPRLLSSRRARRPGAVQVPRKFWCGRYRSGRHEIPDGTACCFNHWVSLPSRWGRRHPLYPWQVSLIKRLDAGERFHFILKPPKIGATELALRYALHRALVDPTWKDGQVALVAFHGADEAKSLVARARALLAGPRAGAPLFPVHKTDTANEFYVNTVKFKAFPALNKHINSIRGQPNMRMIIYDEAAFPTDVDQDKMRDAAEHYVMGSAAIILIITTAGDSPSGFAYDIHTSPPGLYRKTVLNYELGLKKHRLSGTTLYDPGELEGLRRERSFAKNYLMEWGYGTGDIFDSDSVTACSSENYELVQDVSRLPSVLCIDPAYGKVRTKTSSKFGLLGLFKKDGIIYTNSLEELETPSDEQALAAIRRTIKSYGYAALAVDGHWTGIINTFRPSMRTVGYNFGEVGLKMTDGAGDAVAARKVRIHPSHHVLVQQLRAIKRNDRGMPDKTQVRFDVGDCFLMGIRFFSAVQRKIAEPVEAQPLPDPGAPYGFGYGLGNLASPADLGGF